MGQSRKRIANREERESHFLEALDDVYRSEGFDGLSIYIPLVFFLIQFSKSFKFDPDVKLKEIPYFLNSFFIKFLVPP